jgi:threonine aldolase
MPHQNRRSFLKSSGVTAVPAIWTASVAQAMPVQGRPAVPARPVIKFYDDGETFDVGDYIGELQRIHEAKPIEVDFYGEGGVAQALESRFAEITGKKKAALIPTGTLANQLAISVLSSQKSKVFVQETSHVYRDEADAAQAVFRKRLIPLAKDRPYFTVDELRQAIDDVKGRELFPGNIGVVSIENPVRRADGRVVPIEEIRRISAFCRRNGIKLHLDGARLHIASAWRGVPVLEYCSYFDTAYVSLYKYLGAYAGAVLCGDEEVISAMPHLVKMHGGGLQSNWTNTAIALHRLDGLEARLRDSIARANEIFPLLNRIPGLRVTPLEGGTNMYSMEVTNPIDGKKMQQVLKDVHGIKIDALDAANRTLLTVNETLLYRDADFVASAFAHAMKLS